MRAPVGDWAVEVPLHDEWGEDTDGDGLDGERLEKLRKLQFDWEGMRVITKFKRGRAKGEWAHWIGACSDRDRMSTLIRRQGVNSG